MDKPPIRLLIHGASGRMGQALLRLAAADARFVVVAAVSRGGIGFGPVPGFTSIDACPPFDVAVDFSLPDAFAPLLAACTARGVALVTGTTGLTEQQRELLLEAARTIPVLWASNFSLGVVVLEDLVRRAAMALERWPVRLSETHHVLKQDAPSGTALSLARASLVGARTMPEIVSIREGDVIGDHTVCFSGPGETLELRHSAGNRDIFALGALEAAALLAGKPAGRYQLAELLFGS